MSDETLNTMPNMAEKENKAETAEAEKEADVESEAEVVETEEEETTEEPSKEEIDYEAELAKERERGKPDPKKAKESFEERKRKRVEEDDEEVDEDDKPLTKKEAREFLKSQAEQYQKEIRSGRIKEIADSLSTSEAEAALIVEIHKNRSFPQGMPLEEQLEEAYVIANRKKIFAKQKELVRKVNSKETSSKVASTAHHDSPASSAPKLTSAEATALRDAGMVWDGVKRAFKKPIGNGKKFYYFDPKTRKRWTA